MIIRPRPKFFELFFLLKGSILGQIAPQLLAIFIFSSLIILTERHHPATFHFFTAAPFTLLGIAISIFLGFRNNACYDRWWEARRQLGQMIGEMRSLARLTTTLLPAVPIQRRILHNAIAFSYALKAHLRQETQPAEVARYLSPQDLPSVTLSRNPPAAILRIITHDCASALRSEDHSGILFKTIDEHISSITNIQVACERIATTPTPFTYTLLLHRTAYLFCFLLPVSLASTLGYATPFFCSLIAYTFFGLDALGDQLEEPFGEHTNALPLNALTRIIEINLLEALGDPNLPPYLQPIDHDLR